MLCTALLLAAMDLPMPPPPAGMKATAQLVAQSDVPAAAAKEVKAAADEAEDNNSEVEQMRALEEATIEPTSGSDAALRLNLLKLGYGDPTRARLESALDDALERGDEISFSLAPVTDLSAFDVGLVKDRYDIPVEMQPLVAKYIHFFQGPGRLWFRRWMSRSSRYIPLMQPILEAKGLPRDTVYLAMIESGFATTAYSWAHAAGPWQFIAATGKRFGLKQDFWVDERRDPVKSTEAAAGYLTELYKDLGHWYLAWAGYNSGGGRVRGMINLRGSTDFWKLIEGRGFAKETKHYVPKLIACALVAKHPDAFGFQPEEFAFEAPLEWEEVSLTDAVDLEVLAKSAESSLEDIKMLNPSLKRWCTPPSSEKQPFKLRVPKGHAEVFAANFAKLAPTERLNFRVHRVVKGDTLSAIAAMYHSAPEAIMRINGLRSVRALRLNTELAIPVPSASALKLGKSDSALERQVVRARRSGVVAARPEDEIPAGTQSQSSKTVAGTVVCDKVAGKTRVTYGVAQGDSLWSISQRFDCSINDLRAWNENLQSRRSLRIGTSLTIWPGPKADLKAPASKG